MNAKILISILAVAMVSGCVEIPGIGDVTPSVGGGGNGLEITSFTTEPSTVFSGSTVRLIMETENLGGTNVPNSKSLVYLTGSNFNAWKESGTTVSNYHKFGKDMKAQDVVRGVPADTKRFHWSLTAPSITAGQTRQDTFIGRIYDEYQTSANGNIWVYSETEADAAKTAGRSLYTSSFTYTRGPVGLTVSVSPEPVILYGNERTFTLYIKLNNLASGTIYHPTAASVKYNSPYGVSLTTNDLNYVQVEIPKPTGVSSIGNDCIGKKELIAGRETTLVCDVTLASQPATLQSYPFNINVKYGYYTERTATVTVQGKTTTTPSTPSGTECTTSSECPAIDTDGGYNIYQKGTCSWRICNSDDECEVVTSRSDSCNGLYKIHEYMPSDTVINYCDVQTDVDCPSGYQCSDGACVAV